jgi:hypothetical protein
MDLNTTNMLQIAFLRACRDPQQGIFPPGNNQLAYHSPLIGALEKPTEANTRLHANVTQNLHARTPYLKDLHRNPRFKTALSSARLMQRSYVAQQQRAFTILQDIDC